MGIKGYGKGIVIVILLGLIMGSVTYAVNMSSTITQLQDQLLETQTRFQDQLLENQQKLSKISDDYSQLQNQATQKLRYTGNPFATELWPGQLQSENITGMHWYSYYGGELVNCTDNVLGLNGGGGQIWIPLVLYDYGNMVPSNPANLFSDDYASGTWRVPTDFTSIDSLTLIGYGTSTRVYTITTRIWFAQSGENWATHDQTQIITPALTAFEFFSVDLVPIYGAFLGNLTVGDIVNFRLFHDDGFNLYMYGYDLRYS